MLENCEKLNNQAIIYAQKGEYDEAIACFKRALTMQKENYLLWYNLGLTYRDAGDLFNAKKTVEQAHSINPSDEEIIETLSHICFTMGNLDEALFYSTSGLKLNLENPRLWNLTGVINFNKAEYDLAAEAFEHAVTLNPYYQDALFNLRDCYEEVGNTKGVEECKKRLSSL